MSSGHSHTSNDRQPKSSHADPLNELNSLKNIVKSSGIAMVALDVDLSLRFFTPEAANLFGLNENSIGRALSELNHKFSDDQLLLDSEAVLTTHAPLMHQSEMGLNTFFDRRVLPLLDLKGNMQGVIITFSDISEMRRAKQEIEDARAYASSIIDSIRQPLVILDHHLRIVSASPAFYSGFYIVPGEAVGHQLAEISDACLDGKALRRFQAQIQSGDDPVEDCEVEANLSPRGRRTFLLSAHRIPSLPQNQQKTLLMIEDITARKNVKVALNSAMRVAEQANLGKSRFLAAASHDLRQPLQTMSLLQELLESKVKDPEIVKLVVKFRESLGIMSAILNKLLDITQLEAGVVKPELEIFPISQLFKRFHDELKITKQGDSVTCRVLMTGLWVRTDPTLLDQMIRNLVSNALKYTDRGKILLGCRRRGQTVRIEIWDTGPGIPPEHLKAVFDEFHQLDNPARERSRGFGLGLSIVQRLGDLLGHNIQVRSTLGKGSVFSIDVPFAMPLHIADSVRSQKVRAFRGDHRDLVLIVEDDPAVGEALEMVFANDGFQTALASDGKKAMQLITRRALRPSIVISDYNLPNNMNGLEVAEAIRGRLGKNLPVIIVTGDISAATARAIELAGCTQLNKPVRSQELSRAIQQGIENSRLRPLKPSLEGKPEAVSNQPCVYIVEDNDSLRNALFEMICAKGYSVESFPSAEAFLENHDSARIGCLIVDAHLPEMDGLTLLQKLQSDAGHIPAIMVTGYGEITMAVSAMKAGAVDFMAKPIQPSALLDAIERAMNQTKSDGEIATWRLDAAARIQTLTPRELQIMTLIISGRPNKIIAADLSISQRTVENHRASIFRKTRTRSLSDLVRLSIAAS